MKNIGEFSGFFYIKIRMIVETRIYHQQKKKGTRQKEQQEQVDHRRTRQILGNGI